MFEQNVINGPGTGTFTQHTLEIFIMLLGAFLLGVWLGWMLWSRYKQAVEKLTLDNQSLTASADAMRSELNQAKTALALAEADRSNYAAQVETLHRNNGNLRDQLDQLEANMETLSARNRQLETELGLSMPQHQRTVPAAVPLEIESLDFSGTDVLEDENIGFDQETVENTQVEIPAAEPSKLVEVDFDVVTDTNLPLETNEAASEFVFSSEEPEEDQFFEDEPAESPAVSPSIVPLTLLQENAETELAGMAPVETEAQVTAFEIEEAAPSIIPVAMPTLDTFDIDDRLEKPLDVFEQPVVTEPQPENMPFAAFSGEHDDLTVVEGIGPKIQELLNQFGIHSYQQLAETDVSRLNEILASAGTQLAMHDPGTWPAQANLAANGQWDNLKAIQGFLKGGKKPD